MANYAVMEDNKVTNIIVADSKAIAEDVTGHNCIEYTNESPAGIGYTWDGTNFIPPVVEETEEEPA